MSETQKNICIHVDNRMVEFATGMFQRERLCYEVSAPDVDFTNIDVFWYSDNSEYDVKIWAIVNTIADACDYMVGA